MDLGASELRGRAHQAVDRTNFEEWNLVPQAESITCAMQAIS